MQAPGELLIRLMWQPGSTRIGGFVTPDQGASL